MNLQAPSVSVSGCYWTGSSAIIDLLEEHNSCIVFPEEFSAFSYGQFFEEALQLSDLENYNKRNLQKNITRFVKFNESEAPIIFSVIRRFCNLLNIHPESLFHIKMGMNKKLGKNYQ